MTIEVPIELAIVVVLLLGVVAVTNVLKILQGARLVALMQAQHEGLSK